jgi:catechol 2,3-dioxygenase-like lactoylglutathione lyase family enzyme
MPSMPSGIDHLVIAVPDLDAAAEKVTQQVGLAFTSGGRHAGLGTLNRIAFLGDAYLELIAVDDETAANGWAIGAAAVRALRAGGGFATYGLVDEAIRSSVPRLQANGSRLGPVERYSRERPDGGRVEWLSAAPPMLGPDRPPFLIRHLDDGVEWGADAIGARRSFVHPLGSTVVLERLDLAVADPGAVAADCFRDVGIEFQAVASAAVTAAGRHVIRLLAGAAEPTISIGAAVDSPRTIRLLGVRIEIQPR